MSELAKDEGKMLEDDKYGIFKEDSSDDDFNPDDIKNVVNSSSAEEGEEGEEGEEDEEGGEGERDGDDSNEEEMSEEISEKIKKSPKKKKKEETILDIEQLDIDKIDMIEDLKDRGIDISDEEELEKRMREYNEESEKEEEPKPVVIKKKRGRKSKKELEMMHKKRGRKKKVVEKDDNIFLPAQTPSPELNNNKIIIDNGEISNNIELNEEINKEKIGKSSKTKKSKKEKLIKDLGIDPDLYYSNTNLNNNTIISIDESKFLVTINKKSLTDSIPQLNYTPPQVKLDYIELNKGFDSAISGNNNISKNYKNKYEKNTKYHNNNSGIIQINNNNIIINKKNKNNENILKEDFNNTNSINNIGVGYRKTRSENNLLDILKRSKKEKPNKNVTIVGTRENPKYIYISKKIYDENDEEREKQKEEKKKKRREKEKEKDYDKDKENERINFDLEQEIDTKNIIMKYKQQERDKRQFGIQDKFISQEQRLLESIFTELTNKQSLKSMQKLEDLNKRENYLYTSRKAFKDYVKITNTERHIIDDEKNEKTNNKNIIENNKDNKDIKDNNDKEKKEDIKEDKINNNETNNNESNDKNNINNINTNNEITENKMNIEKKEENQENLENKENKEENVEKNENLENKLNKEKLDEDKKIEEYKEKEKKLNKIRVTFNNIEYFKKLFNNLNKKPIKDKKEKVCAITGKPAKYFDPLTKNYYSTVEAFKILRERYYQKEEDCLLFKIQTLSDLASQKKERLKKMIMSENDKPKEQVEYVFNNNEITNKNNNSIKIDSETMSIEERDENKDGNKFVSGNSALLKMINKFGLLKNDGGNEEKKVISHRIYNRNRENCVESGMLLEANKVKLIISKKIFKDKYSSKLPAPEMANE